MSGLVDQAEPGIRLTIGRRVVTGKEPHRLRRLMANRRQMSGRSGTELINWG